MRGQDVYEALTAKGITQLHHANTVITSCTFLALRGLASRRYVASHGLPQTAQSSDDLDQKFGIWDDVFVDTVDIHHRARQVNWYGPVLFVLDVNALNDLPRGSEVLITKKNPTKWIDGEAQDARYFTSVTELNASLQKGTFDQMVTIRTGSGMVPFPSGSASVVVDDPGRSLTSGVAAFANAQSRLAAAAEQSQMKLVINRRVCCDSCKCQGTYAVFKQCEEFFR